MSDTILARINLTQTWKLKDGSKSLWMVRIFKDENPDEIAAFMMIMERKSEVRVMNIVVNPGMRRTHLATALMHWLVDVSDFEKKPMYLEVDSFQFDEDDNGDRPSDDVLRKFYAKFGFIGVISHPFAMVRFPVAKPQTFVNN